MPSNSGSVLGSTFVRRLGLSSTAPHDEQNVEAGGLRCPHWLQKT
jgi:hypothetical protein